VVTYLGLQRLWRPPAETLEAIGVALGDHWRAAAGAGPLKLFRSAPVNWLRFRATVIAAGLTTSPAAADSSDTHPDPHRY
jgi:hypothetical protein